MSSSELRPLPAAFFSGDLPADALYEVLLRIPAKELCRLRAVCPAWRALTSNPLFVAAHKSRHRKAPPLLAVAYGDDGNHNGVEILDLLGNVVKRIPNTKYKSDLMFDRIRVVRTRLDLICLSWVVCSRAFWVLNPATGATTALPLGFSEELEHELEGKRFCHFESCAFGHVSSTREYKALRVSRVDDRQVSEVITFDDTNHGCWRRKQDPPPHICARRQMRLDGVIYFLMDFYPTYCNTGVLITEPGSIASFNLETEEWGVLPGPEQVQRFVQENDDYGYAELDLQLSLAELDGCLVMVQNIHYESMDLWFLTDSEKGIWVKKYSLPSHVAELNRYPFLMLDDGTIFFSGSNGLQGLFSAGEQGDGFLLSYDPRNDTYGYALKLRGSQSIGIYTGSLLSL
ncbi:putative F-box protein At3g17490 [Triticum dicoccoides]|uniref:putative F-box protein At3g17490 n=1 Tax=Triticum dicoccoides TaxID=85692 RepID=UPI001890B8CB|nr:putative F-box protein At3g17490 [Triticum dicoccoides]XP_037442867.1 putative F-box protein At3g17490 [Triticum dicoccoides]